MKCAVCGAVRSYRESDPHGMFGYHKFTAEVIPEVEAEVDADIRGQSDDRT